MAESKREKWANDPVYRARAKERNRINYLARWYGDDEYRKRQLERQREYRSDPKYRERCRKYRAERFANDPEYAERYRKYHREYWHKNTALRARQLARNRERYANDQDFRMQRYARVNAYHGRMRIAWAEFKLRKALEALNQQEGNANGHAGNQ